MAIGTMGHVVRAWVLRILLAALLAMPAAQVRASAVEPLLRQADAVRSSDPQAFDALLARVDAMRDQATPDERDHLRLLQAYREAIRGQQALSIVHARALFEQATRPDLKYRAGLLVANVAAVDRDYALALPYLERALALESQIQDPLVRQVGDGVAGILYNQLGQYELGRQYAESLLAAPVNARNRCMGWQLYTEARWGLKLPIDEAEAERAIDDCAGQGETINANLIRGTLARHWIGQGRYGRALALLRAHLAAVEATGYPSLIAEFDALLAEAYLGVGRPGPAEAHARAALARSRSVTYSRPAVNAHRVLSEAARRRGDLVTALAEYQHYAAADKAGLDEAKVRQYAFLLSRNEMQRKNQSIALLSKQNQILRLQREVSRKNGLLTYLLLGMLAVVVLSTGYWVYRLKRVQHSLRRLARTDDLTGLHNRRRFRELAEAAIARCAEHGAPAGVVLFDLDHFKSINDRYGHAAGDWVLRATASIARDAAGDTGIVGRLGGEELALVLPGCDLSSAAQLAERLRQRLAELDTGPSGAVFPVSASFGCACTASAGYDYEALLALADEAMYRAKDAGRNRVAVPPTAASDGADGDGRLAAEPV